MSAHFLRLSGDVLLVGGSAVDVLVREPDPEGWSEQRPTWRWETRLPDVDVDQRGLLAAARGWLAARRATRSQQPPWRPATRPPRVGR